MIQFKRMKGLAILLSICIFLGMINTNAYAKNDITVSDDNEEEAAIPSYNMGRVKAVSGAAIYVGGPDVTYSSDGSRANPFRTLGEAANSMNAKGPGSYDIIMLGNTLETSTVNLGNGGIFDVSITAEAVSGGAITVSKGFNNGSMIHVASNSSLTVEGSSESELLIFDGGGETYKGEYALIMVTADATLNLNTYTSVQNNINTSTNNSYQGGGITNYGTVNINGGSISNHKCQYGGGIYNYGDLTINSGNISYNHSNYSGGGIYNHVGKNFTLNDGIISNHSAIYGSGIDNRGNMIMNGGILTQNSGSCFYNRGIVTMYKGDIISNIGESAITNSIDGTFHMIDGRISNNSYRNSYNYYMAIYVAGGVFNLSGGSIDNNTGEMIVGAYRGSFHMTGGTINNNTASVVVCTDPEGTFTMSDGEISNNTGKVFDLSGPISLSDNASISAEAGEPVKALLNLEYDACINVSGLLENIASLSIEINRPREGVQILAGPMLTEEMRAKFIIEDTNYFMDNAGRLVFKGKPITLYVDKVGSDEKSVSGSSSDPLLTIQEAVKRIGTSRGTIIIQSDLDLVKPVYIYTDITMKSDKGTRVISPNLPYGDDYNSIFIVEDGTLTLGDKDQTGGELVLDLNKQKEVLGSLIDNTGIVNLYDRAVIRNAKFPGAVIRNALAVTNIDGGSIYSKNTAIGNWMGTVNIVSGTISGYDNKSTGIYNSEKTAMVNMSGGTITGFDDGIYNLGTLNISGGLIRNNTIGINNIAYTQYGTYYEGTLNLSGGSISNNTHGIKSAGSFHMSHSPSIPIGADNSNGIYLTDKTINLSNDLFLSSDKQILIVLDAFKIDALVFTGNSASILLNHDNFILSNSNYGISEQGTIKYIGKPPVYYVDTGYTKGDSDGSFMKPYATLKAAVSAIDSTLRVGTIYICSDMVLDTAIVIKNDITILNYGPDPHTISTGSSNEAFSIYDTGSLTLGCEDGGNDESAKLLLHGRSHYTISNYYFSVLKLHSGVEMYGTLAIFNQGTLYMYGGVITGCESDNQAGGVKNDGIFIMEGGSISNCTGEYGGALYNSYKGTFIMMGGIIEENSSADGVGIYCEGIIRLSDNASIPMKEDGSNKLMLSLKSDVNIDGDLNSTDSIMIASKKYYPGRQILQGDKKVLLNNYQKFIVDPTVTDYCLAEDGALKYIGLTIDCYVDEKNGNDSNTGTKDFPFATLKKAAVTIGSGVGTIHICSDIDLKEIITINGAIQLINEGEPHVILRNPSFRSTMFTVKGQLELGSSELDGEPEVRLLTVNGNKENVEASYPIIRNELGSIILHNGVVLEDNYSNSDGGAISSGGYGGGTVTMKGGVIQNNESSNAGGGISNMYGSVIILGGSIRYNKASREGGGIYHEEDGLISISGGSIHDNIARIGGGIRVWDGNNINISGGKIYNNKARQGGGLALCMTDFTMSGGEIFGNVGLDGEYIIIGRGIDLADTNMTILGNASIASDNEIALANFVVNYHLPNFIVGGPRPKNIPAITFVKYNYDYGIHDYNYEYPIGDQVISSSEDYTLTAQDLSRFQMLDSNYGINTRGKLAANISDSWFSLIDVNNIIYSGKENKPVVVGVNGTSSLVEGRDYQVTYTDNIHPGIASVYITGMGNYGGTVIKKFSISSPGSPYTPPSDGGAPNPTPIQDGPISEIDAEVSVGISRSEQGNTLNATISISRDSIRSLEDVSGRMRITIPIESEELIDQLQDEAVTSVTIDLVLPDAITQNNAVAGSRILLDPDILRTAGESEKDISITVRDEDGKEKYSWSFSGSDLAASDKDIEELDLSLSIHIAEENEELAELLGNSQTGSGNQNNLIINFGHHGDLPAQASIRIYVGDMGYSEGDKLYLYYYNSETGKLDTLPYSSNYVVDSDGYITVDIVHCSEYVLLPKQASTGAITSLRSQISVVNKKITLELGSKSKSTATIQVNLPATLEQVEKLKDKTSGSAVGAVRITYKSGNSKVASVDSTGKITAKKAGKAVITVTVTLYSGKTKTFKVSVTVK